MDTGNIVAGCIVSLIAIVLGVYVSFTVRGKGPILSNSYLWLSKEEREKADKKAEYKLVSIVFGGLATAFAFLALYIFTSWQVAIVLAGIVGAFVLIFAIANCIWTETRKHR